MELVQEYAHIVRRRGARGDEVAEQARDVAAMCLLHEFSRADLELALNLVAAHPSLQVRDGVHAATALRLGIPAIVSADRSFDDVPGLQRLGPDEAIRHLVPQPRR